MKASDLSEEEWRAHQRMRRTLAQADATLAEHVVQRRADSLDLATRRRLDDDDWMQRQHQEWEQRQQQHQATVPPAVRAWVFDLVEKVAARTGKRLKGLDAEVMALCDEAGANVGQLQRRVEALEDRAAKAETATVELLLECERRIADLEQQQQRANPVKPRLLITGSGSDGAA